MIGMSVRAVGSERDDDVGLYSPQMVHNRGDNLTWVRTVEMLVVVVQQRDFANTQRRGGSTQLRLTDVRQRRWTGVLRIAGTMATVAAAVAARSGQQKDVGAFGRVFRERATYPQRFVVGVREYGH